MTDRLSRGFYARPTLVVARDLLNQRLVHLREGQRLSGHIVEVEAYVGMDDAASHARFGKTERNAAMFGPPGHAYVYLIYGIHHCLNVVTAAPETPAAILIRALEPIEGLDVQQQLRGEGRALEELTSGPGRLCQALDINRRFDGADLCAPDAKLWLEREPAPPEDHVAQGPRIGVTGDERALTAPWRFYIQNNPWVSR